MPEERGANVRELFEAQLEAYEIVLTSFCDWINGSSASSDACSRKSKEIPALKGRNLNSLAFQRQAVPAPPDLRPEGAVPFA